MADAEALTALRQQVQQLQQELHQTKQQQQSRNAPANEDVPTGSAEDVRAPTEAFPHAASWRVAVKLPPFWADSPEVWFAQVEAQFSLARITQDRTRYDYVVAHLDARYANEVRDILANPPTDNLYEHLKTALIRRFSLSEEQKIRQLQSAEFAERKPSQLLRHLRALAGTMQVQDSFLRSLWLQRLPPHAQAILQAQVKLPLDELAEIADRVVEASSPLLSPTIQAVAAPLNTTTFTRRIDDIDRRLTSIQQHLDERLRTPQHRHSQSRDRNTTSSPQPDINGPCYYHRRFGRRIFVTDQITKQRYLVDSGSDVCCYPRHHLQGPRPPTSFELSAANQSTIKTYGSRRLHIQLKNLCRDFHWNFVIADVAEPIIGSDFLAHYNLLPDSRNVQLIDATTGHSTPAQRTTAQQPSIKVLSIDNPSPYHAILAEFPGLTRPSGLPRKVQHTTVHYIPTTSGPPVFCRAHRLAPDRMRIGKAEFEAMLREGTARRSDSPCASPLHLVPKKTEGWRPCGDYRALNARTVPDRYPVRHIQDFAHRIHGCHAFSVLDLVKAYTQIPVNTDDVPKTAIITPFGLFEFPFMSFGLRNAGQTFQRFIDDLVRGLDFCFVYLDDILQNKLSFIAQFTTDIQHVSGKDNVVADALSRVATISSAQITADVLAEAQTTDAELQELLKGTSSLQLQEVPIPGHVTSPLGTFPQPSGRFEHVHLDIIGPFPHAGPYRYCLTAIDRYTRWPEAWPLEGITAEDVASAFFTGWIARFGAPRRVTTDQGQQFESHLFRLLGLTIGFERLRTTSYHPCANGMIVRFHRQFKAAIMCHQDSTWLEAIPAVILGLRATFKPDIHATPAELVYGEPLRLPGEFLAALPSSTMPSDPTDFVARFRRTIATLRPSPAAQHSKPTPFVFKELASCRHAFLRDDTVRRPFQPPYSGPHLVARRDDKNFTLRLHGNDVRVSIDRLKPAYIAANEPGSATPPTGTLPQPPTSQPAPFTTRSGRLVRLPDFYRP
ncbi:uncharacterized protein LOC144167908 [Haemaphysalis longicornis]